MLGHTCNNICANGRVTEQGPQRDSSSNGPQTSSFWAFKSSPHRNGDGPKTTIIGQRKSPTKDSCKCVYDRESWLHQAALKNLTLPCKHLKLKPHPLQSKTRLGIGEQGEDANDLPEFPVLCLPPQGACLTSTSSARVGQSPSHLLTFFLLLCVLFLCFGVWVGGRVEMGGLFSFLSPFWGNVAQDNLVLLWE